VLLPVLLMPAYGTVDTHIRRLREKLEGHAGIIETVRGVGYRAVDK